MLMLFIFYFLSIFYIDKTLKQIKPVGKNLDENISM